MAQINELVEKRTRELEVLRYDLSKAAVGEAVVIERYERNIDMYRYGFGTIEKFTKHTPAHVVVIRNTLTSRPTQYQLDGYGIGDTPGRLRRIVKGETQHDFELQNIAADDKLAAIREANKAKANERRAAALKANVTTLRAVQWIEGAPGQIAVVNMVREDSERLTMFCTVGQRECIDWDAPREAPDSERMFTVYVLQVIGYGSGWHKSGFSTDMNTESRTIDAAIENLIVSQW